MVRLAEKRGIAGSKAYHHEDTKNTKTDDSGARLAHLTILLRDLRVFVVETISAGLPTS
jgi:hypothetical protein